MRHERTSFAPHPGAPPHPTSWGAVSIRITPSLRTGTVPHVSPPQWRSSRDLHVTVPIKPVRTLLDLKSTLPDAHPQPAFGGDPTHGAWAREEEARLFRL